MTDPQTPLSDDELLSAYLDGALAGEDLARAQRLLAEQPGSRQLLEELRALGNGLRELPRGRLGESFPERVMRKAERQLLTEAAPTSVPTHSLRGRLRNKRPWIYAAVTLAAGLLVAVFTWQHQSGRKNIILVEMKAPVALADGGRASQFDRYASASAPSRALGESDARPPVALKAEAGASMAEDDATLEAALARLGLVQYSDEIVRQVNADEAAAPAVGQPLSVWSFTVSPDAIQQDMLGQVLVRNQVQVLDEQKLDSMSRKAANAEPENATAPNQQVDVVLVTATPGQLGATLADIRSQSATFRNLAHFGFNSLKRSPLDEAVTRSAAAAPQAGIAGQGQLPSARVMPAAPAANAKQSEPASGGELGAIARDQAGRAVRLRFNNLSGSAMQPPPPLPATSQKAGSAPTPSGTDANENQSGGAKKDKDSEPLSEERLKAKSEQAVKLERALFILRSTEPAAPAPAAPSPAKAGK